MLADLAGTEPSDGGRLSSVVMCLIEIRRSVLIEHLRQVFAGCGLVYC